MVLWIWAVMGRALLMSEREYLSSRFSKSQVGGVYKPITQMSGKELGRLRRKVTGTQNLRRKYGHHYGTKDYEYVAGAGFRLKEFERRSNVGAHMRAEKEIVEVPGKALHVTTSDPASPESVSRLEAARRRMGVKGRVRYTDSGSGFAGMRVVDNDAFTMKAGGRKSGFSLISTNRTPGAIREFTANHEMAHAKPKRSAWRLRQVTRSEKKMAREEGRADGLAARHGPVRSVYQNSSGFHQKMRSLDRAPLLGRLGIGRTHTGLVERTGALALNPKQSEQYRFVRRRIDPNYK